jgi:RNA polymerase sigma-70 factor (ECF subfamily)
MASDDPVKAGEPRERAVPRLVAQQGGRLFALARRFCGNEEEARDLVQETFLAAWKSWDAFEGRSDPGTWLYTIAARLCQRAHRPRAGEPAELLPLDPGELFGAPTTGVAPEESEPFAALVRREAKERLEAAIHALPLEFRMPLVLREIVGLELEDVARILGLEAVTVRTRLHRARLRLRAELEAVLPRKALPAPIFDRAVCLDLLRAKQEALDRGVAFEFPGGVVCERCAATFASLDWTGELCRELGHGELPAELSAWLARELNGG